MPCVQEALVFQSESTHSFIKWSWFCLAVSGKFLTPRLAINNWFNSDVTEGKIIVVEKNASTILITKEAWLTKSPLCPSSILKARERAFHPPFFDSWVFSYLSPHPHNLFIAQRDNPASLWRVPKTFMSWKQTGWTGPRLNKGWWDIQQKSSQRKYGCKFLGWMDLPTKFNTMPIQMGIYKPLGQFTATSRFCLQSCIAFRTDGF